MRSGVCGISEGRWKVVKNIPTRYRRVRNAKFNSPESHLAHDWCRHCAYFRGHAEERDNPMGARASTGQGPFSRDGLPIHACCADLTLGLMKHKVFTRKNVLSRAGILQAALIAKSG